MKSSIPRTSVASGGPEKNSNFQLALNQIVVPGHIFGSSSVGSVSLSLTKGHCLALLGGTEDGGGILIDIVAGHVCQAGGTVSIDGQEIKRLPPEARGIGLISARDPLFPHLDVLENIAFPLHVRQVDRQEAERKVRDSIALLGLDAVAGWRLNRLNAAERIRVKMARALVFAPSLLLLDNPFAGLDSVDRIILQRTLRRLTRARGLTVLLTTDNRDEAFLLGDEIGVLVGGRLHQTGPAATLLDRPVDAVVAERIGDANVLTGQVIQVDDDVALVRLASGAEMEAELGGALHVGAPCMLCVRPDRIATVFLSRPDAGAGINTVPATLLDAVHFGDHLRLRFRLADGGEMLVRRPPAASMAELRPDRIAMLAWQAYQARVFPAPA